MLETRDLVKHYHAGREAVRAVDGVSLSIAAGEFVALYAERLGQVDPDRPDRGVPGA